MKVICQLLSNRQLVKFNLSIAENCTINREGFDDIFRSVAAEDNLTILELNLNDTNVQLSAVVSSVNAWGMKRNLKQLSLKVNHIKMKLKDLKTVLKSVRGINSLSDLKLDV